MHNISNQIVKWQLQGLKARDVDLKPIYSIAGLSEEDLSKPGNLLTAEEFAQLMRSAFELVDDEAAGYTQKPWRLGTFRMMCHATIDCDNLRRAIMRMMEFFRLLSDEFKWSLEEQGEEAVLSFTTLPNGIIDNGYFVASMMTILWRWASWMIDTPILLSRVYFDFSGEFDSAELRSVFRTAIYFDQNANQLVIPSHYLEQPIKQNSESLVPFLNNSPECLLSHYQSDNSFSQQVKIFLEAEQELDTVSLDSMAKNFEISGQTLSRRLKKEGHQFQEIKDKVRKNRAVNLLQKTDLSFAEISNALGFSEDSVFYRNFKKWTGMTPSEYRQNRSK
ncbi:AraC family transcriptional regulator [Aliikangiella marina]|uniref:AraC family transcriptional regulator n=1 Tax=Aliikangiella marina TaxID=1712262 RepID=A0A545TEA8_9GAMM|nr:AraC family transcriptional regulator [Aliikangiella marina]TQV75558.1 AraC family transcriptional regulator [Aliikangiella marina]